MASWFSNVKHISSLEAEVCFLLQDSFYYGPDKHPEVTEGKLVEKLTLPNIPRQVATIVRSSEAIGYEQELATYYTQIVRLARKHHLGFESIRHYFWLRFWLWNSSESIYISFPWYDTFSEIDGFLHTLSDIETGEVYYDIDQSWEIAVEADNGLLYIREHDPDEQEVYLAISVPRTELLSQIAPLRERTQNVISDLRQVIGADVWSSYSYEEPSFRITYPRLNWERFRFRR